MLPFYFKYAFRGELYAFIMGGYNFWFAFWVNPLPP